MRIDFNAIRECRIMRTGGTLRKKEGRKVIKTKVAGMKGKPGSKLVKKMWRANIKEAVRNQRLAQAFRRDF